MTSTENITAITFGIVLGSLQAWNVFRINQVHKLTNSGMTAQKKMLAEVTAAKFAITKDKTDKANADTAMKDYLGAIAKT